MRCGTVETTCEAARGGVEETQKSGARGSSRRSRRKCDRAAATIAEAPVEQCDVKRRWVFLLPLRSMQNAECRSDPRLLVFHRQARRCTGRRKGKGRCTVAHVLRAQGTRIRSRNTNTRAPPTSDDETMAASCSRHADSALSGSSDKTTHNVLYLYRVLLYKCKLY